MHCLGLAGGRDDGKDVGRGDACVRDVRGDEDAFAKGRIGVHVDVFVVFSVVAYGYDRRDVRLAVDMGKREWREPCTIMTWRLTIATATVPVGMLVILDMTLL